MSEARKTLILRGTVLSCSGDPAHETAAFRLIEDGAVVVESGRIVEVESWSDLKTERTMNVTVVDHRPGLIVPGFVDVHAHYPQSNVIATYGTQLLDWLTRFTFPEESKFSDEAYAAAAADFFLDELLRNGTTASMVFCTIHPESVDALFNAASRRNMCIHAGKVMMDSNCPEYLKDDVETGGAQIHDLIKRWHRHGRNRYVLTPRFAPTSSESQLRLCGDILASDDSLGLQTHVAENLDEVEWVKELFPNARSYLDVYERFDLLNSNAVLAHCIYLDAQDRDTMARHGATMAFCPTSNLFLGSGHFDVQEADRHGNAFALATDVGGGTSFSMLRTLGEAYKVAQMTGENISPERLLYIATLAGAKALSCEDSIGSLEPAKIADIVVLNPYATSISARRAQVCERAIDQFFALTVLGDERHIAEVYVAGKRLTVS